jgi:hypothetical protein
LKRVENGLHTRFHGLRFGVFSRLDAECLRTVNKPAFNPKKVDRIREMTRLNDQRRKAVEAANDLGELAHDRFQFFQSYMNRSSLFECES